MRLSVAAAALCLCIVGFSVADDVHASIRKQTNIPAEGLGPALQTLAKDRGFQVVYVSEEIKSLNTQGAIGEFTPEEALKQLLKGTGYTYHFYGGNAVGIVPVADAPQATSGSGVSPTTTGPDRYAKQSLHLAQVDQGNPSSNVPITKQDEEKKKEGLEEIVVTGTHIRGTNSFSPIMTFDREAIDQSGYLTTQEFIQSIPQAFGGGSFGASPDGLLGSGANSNLNLEHASAVNLRGLGENATLILLNGHRLAPSANGNVVDISTLPLSAIDHIDVLTDGASAIYGADAVAGVVNIVLRKDFDGAETQATYGGAIGGLRNEIFTQTLGKDWSTGSVMASYQYEHDGTLPTTARSFTASAPQPTNLINPITENSLVLNGNQRITDKLVLSGDVLATWKSTMADVAYGGTSGVQSFSSSSALNAHLGLNYAINDRWDVDLNGTYARQRTNVGFYYEFGDPIPLGQDVQWISAPISDYQIGLSGRPFTLPGGDLGLAVGAEHRRESAKVETAEAFSSVVGTPPLTAVSRNVNAEYAELRLPFLSPDNNVPFVAQLIASAAVRHDTYSDFGSTTNPKLGVLWSPSSFIDVKANWSRAFRAPSVGELSQNTGQDVIGILPPVVTNPSGGSPESLLYVTGPNPNLSAETATTYDLGFELRFPNIRGFKFSVDYYDVDFKNRLETPPFNLNILLHPNIYGPLITQFPNDAAVAAYVAGLEAKGYQLTDFGLGTPLTGVRYAYPGYLINAAVVRQNGADITGHYEFQVGAEGYQTTLNAAFINKIDTQFAPGTTATNLVNTYGNPLRLRLRWDGAWTHGPVVLATAVNFSNSYDNPFSNPPSSISSFMTVDLTGSMRLAPNTPSSFFYGVTLRLAATNLLNRYPPYALGAANVTGVYYDVGNASPLGRVLSVQLLKKW